MSHLGGICDVGFIGEFGMFSGGFDGVVCRYDWRMMGKEVWRVEYGGTCWRVIPR